MSNIFEILKQTPYNYGFLASSATAEVCLVRSLDVSGAKTVGLSIRVHSIDIGAGGGKFEFILYGTNPSQTDGTNFQSAVLATSTAITTSTAAGSLITLSSGNVLTDPPHPFLRVILKVTGPSGSAANLYGELSASLVLRAP